MRAGGTLAADGFSRCPCVWTIFGTETMKWGRCWRSNDQTISVPSGPTCPEQNRRVVSSVCVRPVLTFCLLSMIFAASTDSYVRVLVPASTKKAGVIVGARVQRVMSRSTRRERAFILESEVTPDPFPSGVITGMMRVVRVLCPHLPRLVEPAASMCQCPVVYRSAQVHCQ